MIRVLFVGGPLDGQYDRWAMQGGRPPPVIEMVTADPPEPEVWTPDYDPPVQVRFIRHQYRRMGFRIDGAELYAHHDFPVHAAEQVRRYFQRSHDRTEEYLRGHQERLNAIVEAQLDRLASYTPPREISTVPESESASHKRDKGEILPGAEYPWDAIKREDTERLLAKIDEVTGEDNR